MRGLMAMVVLGACARPAAKVPMNMEPPSPQAPRPQRLQLAQPEALPAVFVIELGIDREASLRLEHVCPTVSGTRVEGTDWVHALERDGFAAQTGGFEGNGPVAVRFRKGELVGDLFASTEDPDGCRRYALRAQAVGGQRELTWTTPISGAVLSAVCMRFFPDDARFPFAPGTYTWSCPENKAPGTKAPWVYQWMPKR